MVQHVNVSLIGIWHFVVKIAGNVYHAVLDCLSAVAGAFEFVFDKLKVGFEDSVAWLGFVFQWGDIVRTHKVMKNMFKQFAKRAVGSLDTLKTEVKDTLSDLGNKIDEWTQLSDSGKSIGSIASAGFNIPGANSPQSHWALHHMKSNISSAGASSIPSYSLSSEGTSALEKVIADLEEMAIEEVGITSRAIRMFKFDIADQISSLTPLQLIERLVGIVARFIVDSASNVITKIIDVIKIIVDGLIDVLDETIDIPILSSLYKKISGDDLSFLDLFCLVSAIPITIIFKIATGKVPYPDTGDTRALINASDFDTLVFLLKSQSEAQSYTPTIGLSFAASDGALTAEGIAAGCFNIGAFFGSTASTFLGVLRRNVDVPSPLIRYCSVACFLLSTGPNIPSLWGDWSDWGTQANVAITTIAVLKSFADNHEILCGNRVWSTYITPYLDAIINGVWLLPGIHALRMSPQEVSSSFSALGAVVGAFGGIITPGTVLATDPEFAAFMFVAVQACAALYGVFSLLAGVTLLKNS